MTATLTPPTTTTAPGLSPRRVRRKWPGPAIGAAAWLVAAVLALAVWEAVSRASGQWVPSVSEIADSLTTVLSGPQLLDDGLVTLRRVALVTVASVLGGTVIGLAAGFCWPLRAFLRPILVIGLAVPDLVYIIMAILILGATETSGMVAVTVAIVPLVANVVIAAVTDRDTSLDEMAATYRFGRWDYARHVLLDQLKPAMAAAVRTGFAFSWKLVVLMETITTPDGIGARIYEAFRFLRPQDMIAYALVFIVVMKFVEWVIVLPLRPSARR
uniref:Putative ABC-type nitrate/sulfonate/bicarbonate transport system, permease component n=1 Tax=Rhodococcus sp. PY11 TaxID=551544 RepID=B5MAC2_9NOCA|nr:putative ABC-type nitrate/sulfonate/bicarbonate transport system, permease component [Rhodococcus sp. PY11]